jgi:signal peptidase I
MVAMATGGWLFSGYTMTSAAMADAVKEGNLVLISRLAARTMDPRRGDVILFQVTGEENQLLRRIVGLPGESVEVRNGDIFINGVKLDEPWLVVDEKKVGNLESGVPVFFGPTTVPPESYFVLGDNRLASRDSRLFGPVNRELMIGKALSFIGVITF